MFKNIIKIAGVLTIMLLISINTGWASDRVSINFDNNVAASSLDIAAELIGAGEILIKRGEPYDESQDPAMHKSSPPDEGPQHGFFAVSILVLLIAGIFIYFIKLD